MNIELSLYKIADAMQVKLNYLSGNITGGRGGEVSVLPDVSMPFRISAKAVYLADQIGVLFHISGDLYNLVSHYPKTGAVTMMIVDGSGITDKWFRDNIAQKSDTATIRSILGKRVVKMFFWKNDSWSAVSVAG